MTIAADDCELNRDDNFGYVVVVDKLENGDAAVERIVVAVAVVAEETIVSFGNTLGAVPERCFAMTFPDGVLENSNHLME